MVGSFMLDGVVTILTVFLFLFLLHEVVLFSSGFLEVFYFLSFGFLEFFLKLLSLAGNLIWLGNFFLEGF
jgi:hypothetical protein